MCKAIREKSSDYKEQLVKIGVIQLKGFSLNIAEKFIQQAVKDHPDVVVLPEIGCGTEPQNLTDSKIVKTMKRYAYSGKMYIVVNLIEKRDNFRTFNTTLIISRNGEVVGLYRKVHIPLSTEENSNQDGGDKFPVFDLDFGRVGIEVCFDNYFPEVVRSLALAGAEIVFFPHQEHYIWNDVPHVEILSRARAIENVLYMVPCGPTAAEKGPYGRTAVISPTGEYLLQIPPDKEAYASVAIDLGLINRILIDKGVVSMREQMLRDQREEKLRGRRRPEVYKKLIKI